MTKRQRMQPGLKALVVTGMLLCASPLAAQVRPPTAPGPGLAQAGAAAKAPTGIIRGRVVSAVTGAPLRRARVVVAGPGPSRATSSDTDGRYEFRELPPARYTLWASKPMYLTLKYGQAAGRPTGRPMVLADGEVLEKIDVALPKGGVIAGHVFDELGEPAEYVRVGAMQIRYLAGRRQIVPVARSYVRTNDLGEFRIYGLAPGRYYVGTPPPAGDSVPRPVSGRVFGPSYFAGTPNIADARPIDLEAGQERLDADFGLVVVRPAKIAGMVLDRQGRPVTGVSVLAMQSVAPASGGYFIATRGLVQPDGAFTIENLAPGDYTLTVQRTNPATGAEESASRRVTVSGADIDGVVMTAIPAVRVTGRIRMDPPADPAPALKDIHIISEPLEQSPVSMGEASAVASDWTFEVRDLAAGPTRFAISSLPPGWVLKAIVYDRRDVTDTLLDLREDVGGVEIVLTNRLTEITGAVTDASDHPVSDYNVLVYPEDPSRWEIPRYFAGARPDQNGRFFVSGLPPGKYLVVALDEVGVGDAMDPDNLERMRSRATSITLGDGETKAVDLKVVTGK